MKRLLRFHSNAVWPPALMQVIFIFSYVLVAGMIWFLESIVPPAIRNEISNMPELARVRTGVLVAAAGVYGLYRLARFHPICNQGYLSWLKMSPWTPEKPLPLGPVHLVWQDAAVIGLMCALAKWHAHVDPRLPLAAFALAYLAGLTILLVFSRAKISCLLLGFLWPALALPGMNAWMFAGVVGAIILTIGRGYRKSLYALPAKSVAQTEVSISVMGNVPVSRSSSIPGWPYSALSPKFDCVKIKITDAFLLSLQIGWWVFCAILISGGQPVPPEMILVFALLAAFIRFGIYSTGFAPPFNLAGRIATGQVIVPGYDQIFLAPILAVIAATAAFVTIRWGGSWAAAAEACVAFVVSFLLLGGGPTLRKWSLTGQHRHRTPVRVTSNKALLRRI